MTLHLQGLPLYGSTKDLRQSYEKKLHILLQQGNFKPVFFYHVVFLGLLPLIGLAIPRGRGARFVRPLVFALILGVSADIVMNRRALVGGNGYAVGVITAWWLIWNATLLIFTDVEHDFQRVERVPAAGVEAGSNQSDASPSDETTVICAGQCVLLRWQTYPVRFTHRIYWCLGLLLSPRRLEWNWRSPHVGPIPRSVHEQLQSGFKSGKFPVEHDVTFNAKQYLQGAICTFLACYLLLDILKTVMMRDPYFRGIIGADDAVPPFPFSALAHCPQLIRFYHCFFCITSIYVATNTATSVGTIVFVAFSLASPTLFHKLTYVPLDAPWLHTAPFGPFSVILDHGLAGLWGRWWHQFFRYGFTATARWILLFLPISWRIGTRVRHVMNVIVAFSLSGFIHACGSHTQVADTLPLVGSFLFFFLQGIGIIVDTILKTAILPKLHLAATPRWLRRAANAVFLLAWMLFSGPLIVDDFFKGGLGLLEPIPVSPLRGLGIARGGEWFYWSGPWLRYWNDATYWGSGMRVV